jgi:EmrB/QacA subfamily drug resistance transporter
VISKARRRAITAGLLLGMSLGALEATVVGTAMPTVVATLGGLAHYSWVFSAYLLTSTASVPIWGRLSDLYGRRRMFLTGVLVFLVGSALAGAAPSMYLLIAARAFQGLGSAAIVSLSMTIIGELYTLAERARTQALFSGIWGIASIAGPLVGGYITDVLDWRWVFYLNIPFGLLAMGVIALSYPASRTGAPARVDWGGAALMFAGVSAVLLAIGGEAGGQLWWLIAGVVLLAAFIVVERRVADPILPLGLVRQPVVARTLAVAFLLGAAMFGAIAFIPLFVQAVLGGSATQAGQVLTPLFLGWVGTSILGAKLTVRVGYRRLTRSGVMLIAAGFGGLAVLDARSPLIALLACCFVIGAGMGFAMLSLLLAIQHGVARAQLGLATSLNQFARSIGAATGIAAMGALMTRRVGAVDIGGATASLLPAATRAQFALGLHDVFLAGAVAAFAALAATLMLPHVDFGGGVPAGSGERMLAAEMTNLDAHDEPSSLNESA